jgi:hypothetical protein
MGDFYHPIPVFFGMRGVGIHNVITKIYHMSVITLISRKICDKSPYKFINKLLISVSFLGAKFSFIVL